MIEQNNRNGENDGDGRLPKAFGPDKAVLEHMRRLAESVPSGESIITLREKKEGFELDEEVINEILGARVNTFNGYYGDWDFSGAETTLLQYPLTEPQPEGTQERGELHITWKGEDFIFSLPPTAYRNFARFFTKWEQRGFSVVGATIHIRSKLVKTKAGYLVNIPKFILVQPGNMDQGTINAETVEEDIPF